MSNTLHKTLALFLMDPSNSNRKFVLDYAKLVKYAKFLQELLIFCTKIKCPKHFGHCQFDIYLRLREKTAFSVFFENIKISHSVRLVINRQKLVAEHVEYVTRRCDNADVGRVHVALVRSVNSHGQSL